MITYKDISNLTQVTELDGSEVIPVSSKKRVNLKQIITKYAGSGGSNNNNNTDIIIPNNTIRYRTSDHRQIIPNYKDPIDLGNGVEPGSVRFLSYDTKSDFGEIVSTSDITTISGGGFISYPGYSGYMDGYNRLASKITEIWLPDSLESVLPGMFAGCNSLKRFHSKFASDDGTQLIINGELVAVAIGSIPPSESTDQTLCLDPKAINIGRLSFGYSKVGPDIVVFPDTTKTITSLAFFNNSKIHKLITGKGLCDFDASLIPTNPMANTKVTHIVWKTRTPVWLAHGSTDILNIIPNSCVDEYQQYISQCSDSNFRIQPDEDIAEDLVPSDVPLDNEVLYVSALIDSNKVPIPAKFKDDENASYFCFYEGQISISEPFMSIISNSMISGFGSNSLTENNQREIIRNPVTIRVKYTSDKSADYHTILDLPYFVGRLPNWGLPIMIGPLNSTQSSSIILSPSEQETNGYGIVMIKFPRSLQAISPNAIIINNGYLNHLMGLNQSLINKLIIPDGYSGSGKCAIHVFFYSDTIIPLHTSSGNSPIILNGDNNIHLIIHCPFGKLSTYSSIPWSNSSYSVIDDIVD